MNKLILIFVILLTAISTNAQTTNHWETIVFANSEWKYLVGTEAPANGWHSLNFNDTQWANGTGGFGYGDNDDGTTIPQTMSVFLRKKFTISDLSKITKMLLHADFDDGFIAYINGVEIARYLMSGTLPGNTTNTDGFHEAGLYQGHEPEQFVLNNQKVNELLNKGENILAVQVHNENINSSDLSSNFYLSAGINDTGNYYSPTPDWFTPPITLNSNLPIIKIETDGQTIPDDPRIVARMSVINYTGRNNYEDDLPNEYNGRITIETRGSSSQEFPKKSYALETQDPFGENLNISLLGMPQENDWILYAPYSDKSLMRNVLAFKLARDLGKYAGRTRYCELIINGSYVGVYVLMEKIKSDKNRLDIAEVQTYDITGDELTGGYILKFDKTTGGADGWYTGYSPWPRILYDEPDFDEIVPEQKNYIQQAVSKFEDALHNVDLSDEINGYRKYARPETFIDFLFVNEISKNVDGYRLSSFFHKEKDSNGGKINMGPVWDFNLGFGNADYFDVGNIGNYSYVLNDFASPFWWYRFMEDESFIDSMQCRWQEFRKTKFHTDSLMNYIDSMANYIDTAQERNFNKWKILDRYVWPNEYIGGTFENEINYLKNWTKDRLDWLDANLPGKCVVNKVAEIKFNEQNLKVYPNPFEDKITMRYTPTESGEYSFLIKNITGQVVFSKQMKAIANSDIAFVWNAENSAGIKLPGGFYLCSVYKQGKIRDSSKIILK